MFITLPTKAYYEFATVAAIDLSRVAPSPLSAPKPAKSISLERGVIMPAFKLVILFVPSPEYAAFMLFVRDCPVPASFD